MFLSFPVFLPPFTLLIPLLIVFPPSIQHVHTPSIVLPPQFTVIFSPFIHIISASVHQIVSIYSQYFSSSVHNIIPAVLFYFLCLSYFGYFFSIYPIWTKVLSYCESYSFIKFLYSIFPSDALYPPDLFKYGYFQPNHFFLPSTSYHLMNIFKFYDISLIVFSLSKLFLLLQSFSSRNFPTAPYFQCKFSLFQLFVSISILSILLSFHSYFRFVYGYPHH